MPEYPFAGSRLLESRVLTEDTAPLLFDRSPETNTSCTTKFEPFLLVIWYYSVFHSILGVVL